MPKHIILISNFLQNQLINPCFNQNYQCKKRFLIKINRIRNTAQQSGDTQNTSKLHESFIAPQRNPKLNGTSVSMKGRRVKACILRYLRSNQATAARLNLIPGTGPGLINGIQPLFIKGNRKKKILFAAIWRCTFLSFLNAYQWIPKVLNSIILRTKMYTNTRRRGGGRHGELEVQTSTWKIDINPSRTRHTNLKAKNLDKFKCLASLESFGTN